MLDFLQIAASGGDPIFLDIMLVALTIIWGGILIGIIVHSRKKYGVYQKQKDLIMQANKGRK